MITQSSFIKSITHLKYRPFPRLSEIFLIGRSNVGKSSFINALTNNKKLAFISKKPGKTITLNYFLLNNSFHLVDSPGYGYMNKNFTIKKNVFRMINTFLKNNLDIKILFQLIDFKIGPTLLDLEIYKILKKINLQPILILSKKDKVLLNKVMYRLKQIKQIFYELGYLEIQMYLLSCKNKEGLNHIVDLIHDKIKL